MKPFGHMRRGRHLHRQSSTAPALDIDAGTSDVGARSEASSSPLVSVAILTRNRPDDALRCIDTIYQQAHRHQVPLLVLVNGSDDDSAQQIRERFPEVEVHESSVNLGCPGGRNWLASTSGSNWLAYVDDDGTVGPDFVTNLLREIRQAPPECMVLAGNVIDKDLNPAAVFTAGRRSAFSGGICAIRRSEFLAIGGYPTDGLRQGEEGDLTLRLHDAGYIIIGSADLILYHPLVMDRVKRLELLRTGLCQSVLTGLRFCPAWAVVPWVLWKLIIYLWLAVKLRAPAAYLGGLEDAMRLVPATLSARRPVRFGALLESSGRFRR